MTPERLQQIKERYADEMIRREHVAELIDTVDHLSAENARLRAGIEALARIYDLYTEPFSDDLRYLLDPTEGEER